MKKSYELLFKEFWFENYSNIIEPQTIDCSAIDVNCLLIMRVQEAIRNQIFSYKVSVRTIKSLKKFFKNPGFLCKQRLAIVNCNLVNQIPMQLQRMIEKANECEGFIPTDYLPGPFPIRLADAYLSSYFRSTELNSLDFCDNFFSENLEIDKMQFCDKPWELDTSQEGYERYIEKGNPYVLTAGQVAFCSWRFTAGKEIKDEQTFYTTIIFTAYDHFRDKYFELSIDACSLAWLEEAYKDKSLQFFRYLMIVDRWNTDYLKEYVFYTVRAAYAAHPGYTDYVIATLSLGYQLTQEYQQYAEETGEPYAYY